MNPHERNGPKYLQLAAVIERRIRQGQLRVDEPLPAHRELMEEFGVSLATIRRALDILDSKGLLRRVPGRGVFVAHTGSGTSRPAPARMPQPSALESQLRNADIALLGRLWEADNLVCNHWCERIVRGVESGLRAHGAKVRVFELDRHPAFPTHVRRLATELVAEGISGVMLISGTTIDEPTALLGSLVTEQLRPVVVAARQQLRDLPINVVTVDLARGLARLVEHLTQQGHHQLLFLAESGQAGEPVLEVFRDSQQAAEAAILRAPRKPTPAFVRRVVDHLEAGVTAVVASSDALASSVIGSLVKEHWHVPEDVSVAGLCEDFRFRYAELTTCDWPLGEIGRAAVDVLNQAMDDSAGVRTTQLRLAPRLAIRQTTGPARR